MVTFFFVRDHRREHRLFSSEPPSPVPVKFSKTREIWELAKKKLMLLPQRVLRQEQAFGRACRVPDKTVTVFYGGVTDEKWINTSFHFFLNKRRTQRLLLLIGEAIVAPFAGLMALLPGPNVIFYALALLIITHWQSFQGIRCLLRKEHAYTVSALLEEWERAVAAGNEAAYGDILARIETDLGVPGVRKILWE